MTCVDLLFVRIGNGCWESKIPDQDSCISFRMKGKANAIDLHYYFNANKEPEIGSKLRVVLVTDKLSDYDTIFVIDPALSGSSELSLFDTTMCEELFLQGLPSADAWSPNREIYAKFLPFNKGLEAFVERTGLRGLLDK